MSNRLAPGRPVFGSPVLVSLALGGLAWGVAVLCAAGPAGAKDVEGADPASARIRHLLRRATFGVRGSDVERVRERGIEAWVDRQLEPSLIPDPRVGKRLEGFEILKLSGRDYVEMIRGGAMMSSGGPPKAGEDRIQTARRRQAELNRRRNLARYEVPASVVLRAVYSDRQLAEVMAEFWRNHFNVDINKDDVRYYVADWEREVLRKHMFGRFEDFLLATAKHPAMLFYLDNHVSKAGQARGERVLAGREREDRTGGLNENYARELMELHTVGVDNGYDQDDVIQLALVLTGWSIDNGEFAFRENDHARGTKRVMGKAVKSGDLQEGESVVRYLARHKHTRDFVVTKMARYLQADEPSTRLIGDVVKVWKKTKGDLKAVTKAILLHKDFYSPDVVLRKAKTPFEFVVSCLRVTGADVTDARAVLARLSDMAQAVYHCEDPTGYSDEARDWMDPGVLAVRWQFAYDMVNDRLPGVRMAQSPLLDQVNQNPDVWEFALIESLLANEQPGSLTMAPFRRRIQVLRENYRKLRPQRLEAEFRTLATLILGSPEFQRQ